MAQRVINASDTFSIGGDLPVRRLGFGAMRVTGPGIWGDPSDPAEARRVVARLPDLEVDLIDTADSYGPFVSEDLIREVLHPYAGAVVATKGGLTRHGPDVWMPVGRPEYLRQCVLMSLRRLGVERIDLWQLHRIDPKVPRDEQFEAIKAMRDEGLIRHVGLSIPAAHPATTPLGWSSVSGRAGWGVLVLDVDDEGVEVGSAAHADDGVGLVPKGGLPEVDAEVLGVLAADASGGDRLQVADETREVHGGMPFLEPWHCVRQVHSRSPTWGAAPTEQCCRRLADRIRTGQAPDRPTPSGGLGPIAALGPRESERAGFLALRFMRHFALLTRRQHDHGFRSLFLTGRTGNA